MKKRIKKKLVGLSIAGALLAMLLLAAMQFKLSGDAVFSVCLGHRYRKVGETTLQINGKAEKLAVYKAEKKPFLIIGPYHFEEGYDDFFFVNRSQVIRTATDKGGDVWVRFGNQLFMLDDMTGADRLRMPYWDDMKADDSSSIRFDDAAGTYIYFFKINHPAVSVSLTVPSKFFTSDMIDVPNFTFGNQ